jgi:2-dehydropantoate 2-reductase
LERVQWVAYTRTFILEKGGAKVTAVCRSNYDAVRKNGTNISSNLFGNVVAHPTAVKCIEEVGDVFDYIVVCTKAFPGASAAIQSAVARNPEVCIVLCQNGIEIEQEYAEAYSGNPIISGVVNLPTTQVEPGYIDMGSLQQLQLGAYPSTSSKTINHHIVKFAENFIA